MAALVSDRLAQSTVTAAAGGAFGLTITGAGQPSTAAHSSSAT